jgi:polyphosphate kinase
MGRKTANYFNRELSWLEFNQRVLDESRDKANPLLERLKFLAITGSNLDEFFMVRVGGLFILRANEVSKTDPSGMTPAEQLAAISERVHQMAEEQYTCLSEELAPKLAAEGIQRRGADDLTERQRSAVEQVFLEEIYPALTPVAVHAEDDFLYLINQTLNVCVRLAGDADSNEDRFAVIPFGRSSRRFLTLPSEGGYEYTLLEDAVALFIDRFFPGMEVLECTPFRLTRNADIAVRDDTASDLLVDIRELLDARKSSHCVRLEISETASDVMSAYLQERLDVSEELIYRDPSPLALTDLMQLTGIAGFDRLRFEPWPPLQHPEIDPGESMFETISRQDVLLCHPYESFDPCVRLIEEAAEDPDVLAIKQTLYRTSRDSPIVAALARAAQRGKYVTALVELKARFDEARNIEWAQYLEQQEVQIIYGVRGLKTHAKICIIVRREPHGVQRYLHFGTGNYNENTARLYSDISFMTVNEELGTDAISFFHAITGYSQPQQFRKIEAAPIGLRERLLEMIDTETRRKQQGQKAHIAIKLNALVDSKVIDALYRASQAGVDVKLNVRGICCLRPGVEGLSENISVISIVGRFLEHARIFYFFHGGDERVFISSADWMPRNLDRRVELLTPIESTAARRQLISILDTYFRDTAKARELQPDGSYRLRKPERGKGLSSQDALYREVREAVQRAEQSQPTVFEPHRPGSE